MFTQLLYLFQFKSSFIYKLGYLYSSIIKFFRLKFLGEFTFTKFPFSGEFIIENSIGKFKIHEPSDMHSILNPNSEVELYPFFQVNGGIFLDIGTNVGKYSVYVAKQTPTNTVYSFEPNTPLFQEYLSENIKLNHLDNVILVNKGLSDKIGTFNLSMPENTFGSASLETPENADKSIPVEITTLNNFVLEENIDISRIKLIKIDVEGHEYKALLGANNVFEQLKECRLIIEIFKYSPEYKQTLDLIRSFGFELEKTIEDCNYVFYKK